MHSINTNIKYAHAMSIIDYLSLGESGIILLPTRYAATLIKKGYGFNVSWFKVRDEQAGQKTAM